MFQRQKRHSDFLGADSRVLAVSPSLTPTSPYKKQPNTARTHFPRYLFPQVTWHRSFLHQQLLVEHLQCALDTGDALVREADVAPCWNGDFRGETENKQENHTNLIAYSKLIGGKD